VVARSLLGRLLDGAHLVLQRRLVVPEEVHAQGGVQDVTTSDVRTPLMLSTSPWNGPQKSASVSRHRFSPFATSSSASSSSAVNP
jgi:hypothetical protein